MSDSDTRPARDWTAEDAERFAFFLNRAVCDPKTGCWSWGKKANKVWVRGQIGSIAHYRSILTLILGRELAITEDVRHLCDNNRCLNPAHLVIGDRIANMKDTRGRKSKLTPVQWAEVFKEREAGSTWVVLSQKYGVSEQALCQMRRVWKDREAAGEETHAPPFEGERRGVFGSLLVTDAPEEAGSETGPVTSPGTGA